MNQKIIIEIINNIQKIEAELQTELYSLKNALELTSASPPRKEWVGLTKEDIQIIVDLYTTDNAGYDIYCDGEGVARAIEAKLRSKNS